LNDASVNFKDFLTSISTYLLRQTAVENGSGKKEKGPKIEARSRITKFLQKLPLDS